MVSNCIVTAGENDPNFSTKDFHGTGVQQIEHNTKKIESEADVVAGNLVPFHFKGTGWPTHIGMIAEVWKDKDGKIIWFRMYESHGGEGPDEMRTVFVGQGDLGKNIFGYYKWDTKPDTPMDAKTQAEYNNLMKEADELEKKGLYNISEANRNRAQRLKTQ